MITSKKNGTKTSSFGVSRRENHDSSTFYNSRLYTDVKFDEKLQEIENPVPPDILDKVLCQDSQRMDNIPDSCIHLMVTSPPYNVGKEYDKNLSFDDYFVLLKNVFTETFRVLVNGGRACINIANVGRKPYIPYHKFVIDAMINIGFLMRGEIIWDKGTGAGVSTAWGSWCSSSNPTLRDTHEYILIFSKGKFSRKKGSKNCTITKDEFLEFTKSIWRFPPESASKVNHPAPFPPELPRRCIQLYTFEDEIVLDPFGGAGATAIASIENGRHFISLDNNPMYIERARKRVQELVDQRKLTTAQGCQRRTVENQ